MKKTNEQATEECRRLLSLAAQTWPKDEELARRYVKLAFKMAMRHRVHLNPRAFCKKCFAPFVSDTLKVRLDRGTKTVLYSCRKCNNARRTPYKKKKGK